MRGGFADFSPAVPAALAAGLGISLWIFLLPAGGVEKGPTPLVPALGAATGRVAADLPVPARRRVLEVPKAVAASSTLVVALRPPTAKAPPAHHQARTGTVRRASLTPVRTPVREAPVTKTQLFSIKAKGKARGRARGHAPKLEAEPPAPNPPDRGKALGRSNEHEHGLPPGLAKKASPAWAPGHPPRSKGNGGGNGRKGDGGGNRGNGNGGGNGRKGEEN